MFEKVSSLHPDKVADRIAGAIVDLAYAKQENPKVACEVLIGHGNCHIINETSAHLKQSEVVAIVERITGSSSIIVDYKEVPQDTHLADNQESLHCGDNGIFKGMPTTEEQKKLSGFAKYLYTKYPYDGKYILDEESKKLIICQSHCDIDLADECPGYTVVTNPLGYWTGGPDVDSGATNRKLGSDMGDAVTGGGLCGKDLSKADVSVNVYCHILAQELKRPVYAFCAIGDNKVKVDNDLVDFSTIVETARAYIKDNGGFEKFAEWGLI